jgi:hypothetical protein
MSLYASPATSLKYPAQLLPKQRLDYHEGRAVRLFKPRADRAAVESASVDERTSGATEFAWRTHDAVGNWTARVDTKASIALAIEAAVLGFVVTLATGDGELADSSGWTSALLLGGVCVLLLSVALSILVVFPQLRGRKSRREHAQNFVYFGHLRHWNPTDLEARLAATPVRLAQLSRQLVHMSRIAWRKHVWLQWSLSLLMAGLLLVGAALVTSRTSAPPTPNHDLPTHQVRGELDDTEE